MVKKIEQMRTEIREKMRGGNGSVEMLHILEKDEIKVKARLFAKVTLNPGCSIGVHDHVDEEEVYYILKGTGKVNDNGAEKMVQAGDVILTGNGAFHSLENSGNEPLELMAVILLYR